jgi:hypothetical protein
MNQPSWFRRYNPLCGSAEKLPTEPTTFESGRDMKVVEASFPERLFVQQDAHKSNEYSLGLGQKYVTAIGTWR